MNLIQSHGRVPNAALKPSVAFGGQYKEFVAQLNAKVRPARSSGKVALAIPPTTVAKGATATITLRPLVDFKGEQLIVSESSSTFNGVAAQFTINSIKVGRDEQFVAAGAVPAQVFSQQIRRSIGLNMKVCPTSLSITIQVTNRDAAAGHVFAGMLVGSCGMCNEDSCGVGAAGDGDAYEPLVALAIPATNVLANATTTITVPIEVPFTGQQLVIPTSFYDATQAALEDVSAFFSILSVKVGRDEMLTSTDALPASVFAINSQRDIGLSMKKCPTQLSISITVQELSGAPHEFTGAFYGFCGDSGNCNTGLCTDYDIGVAAPVQNYAAIPAGRLGMTPALLAAAAQDRLTLR